MGRGTSSEQQAPEQGVSPEVTPEVVVSENALMAAQREQSEARRRKYA